MPSGLLRKNKILGLRKIFSWLINKINPSIVLYKK